MSGKAIGSRNKRWNGGITEVNGYRFIAAKYHPRRNARGYVREHILVAERALGRELPLTAVVHHANGKRNDNRPENLVICENELFHRLLHQRHRAYLATGTASSRLCLRCKQWGIIGSDGMVAYKNDAYHLACAAAYSRDRRKLKSQTVEGL